MKKMFAVIIFLSTCSVFCWLPAPETADQNQSGKALVALREKPKLEMRVHQVDKSIAFELEIDVILTNTYDCEFTINSIDLLIPDIFRLQEGKSSNQRITPVSGLVLPYSIPGVKSGSFKVPVPDIFQQAGEEEFEVQTLSPGCELVFPFRIPGVKSVSLGAIFTLKSSFIKGLLFIPKKYPLRCIVNFNKSIDNKRSVLQTSTEIMLKPPLSSVIFGGIIGAFLLALFVPVYRYITSQGVNKLGWKQTIVQVGAYFLSGSIISIIGIFVLQRLSDSNLPINIVVDDYIGGIIIGLSSFKLCDWIYQKFSKKQ